MALAWWPDEFVSDDILIDRIWGSSLPEDPRDSLYTSAKRLRREGGLDAADGTVGGHGHVQGDQLGAGRGGEDLGLAHQSRKIPVSFRTVRTPLDLMREEVAT